MESNQNNELEGGDEIIFKEEQVDHCSFDQWFPNFENVTLKSKIIELTEEFVGWLDQDGLLFKEEGIVSRPDELDRFDACESEWSEEDEREEENEMSVASFPQLEESISQIIKEFEGAVIPKLNWSSPKDATFMMTNGSMKCHKPEEIFLLLKSSDFISHDLSHAYEKCNPKSTKARPNKFVLVLRKWYDMKSSLEFRCFVKNSDLVGISQRDDKSYYSYLSSAKEELKGKIINFFEDKIKNKFPDNDYCFDVYIHSTTKRVFLLDFNPFGEVTDGLLFSWEELHCWNWKEKKELEFRIVESKEGIKPLSSENRVPFDLIDRSEGSALSELIEKLKNEGNIQNRK